MSLSETFSSTPKSTLKDLIQTLHDGQAGFKTASEAVKNPRMKEVFTRFSLQRAEFAMELEPALAALGEDEPQKVGTHAGSVLHRGWLNVRAALDEGTPHPILEEAERGEDAAKKAYKEALQQLGFSTELRLVIARQAVEIQKAHDEIKALRDATH